MFTFVLRNKDVVVDVVAADNDIVVKDVVLVVVVDVVVVVAIDVDVVLVVS